MRKYDFSGKIKRLDGTELEMTQATAFLGFLEKQSKSKNSLKIRSWGESLHKDQCLILDKADNNALKSLIKADEVHFDFIKGSWEEILMGGGEDLNVAKEEDLKKVEEIETSKPEKNK
ncbi:hypothetical protein KAR91_10630 [Candidatus Pacearchaeota archaeon]|nr:hypothetical protein [Candidatus Pacearchaeota archaeon]